MKKAKICLTILITIIIIGITKTVSADLKLNTLEFEANIQENGDMKVTEYWNIRIEDTNTLYKYFKRDSTKFSGISDVLVTDITNGRSTKLTKDTSWQYHVTKNHYYGTLNKEKNFEIGWGVGLDNSTATREYKIEYTVKDAITKYEDCAELYWQFIGNGFEVPAKKVTGKITLPQSAENKEDIKVWGHTEELNGEIYATSSNTIEFKLDGYNKGNMLEVRILFPTEMIQTATREKNIEMIQRIIDEETEWVEEANAKRLKAKNIFIQVDEDHVKERGKKGCTISKIITIYTRKRTLTKPDRIPEVKQVRKELVDKFTFAGLYKDTQEMWEDVGYYIDCMYKKDEIENVFIMGDGASYIKAGVEWIEKAVFVLDKFHLEEYINHLNYDEHLKSKLKEAIDQYDPINTENIMNEAIKKIEKEIKEDEELGRDTKRLKNRLKKIEDTKKYFVNQWDGIEAHDKYKDKITGCCQEGQVHHTLSERMSTDAKVWCEEGIDEMSQLRAFTQNGGNIYQKIIDISTEEKREKKIEELEKRIRKKANKKLFGTVGTKIPIGMARDELYYELKEIWYGKAI